MVTLAATWSHWLQHGHTGCNMVTLAANRTKGCRYLPRYYGLNTPGQ